MHCACQLGISQSWRGSSTRNPRRSNARQRHRAAWDLPRPQITNSDLGNRTMNSIDRFRGCLLRLATGDAVGTTLEFRARGTFEPLTDMIGGGPFHLKPGQWTDDTSMALCLATSLVERKEFDADDQMRRYCRWQKSGYLSSNGSCVDIGGTVVAALGRYRQDGNPFAGSTHPRAAANGCIMRLAPIPIYFFPVLDAVEQWAGESSRTTHGATECIDACRLLGRIICRALLGRPKDEVLLGDAT